MSVILKIVPASLIRWAGRAQFRFPLLRPLIHGVGQWMTGTGVIRHGPAKGLRINATGSHPGYLAGTTDPLEQRLLTSHLKPGSVFYDVGANIGFYALLGARLVGSEGRVYAFEPTPQLCRRIRENAAMNNYDHIEVAEAAVYNRDGKLTLSVVSELSTQNRVATGPSTEGMSVPSITLDTFSATHRPPDLLLIDIEGAELEALEGAMKILERYRPTILVEVHWLGQRFIEFVDQRLRPLGYSFQTYEGGPIPLGDVRYHAILAAR